MPSGRRRHEAVAEGHVFDDRIGPYGNPAEVNEERNDVDLESPADREKDIQKADEDQGGADDHSGDTQLLVSPVVSPFRGPVRKPERTFAEVCRCTWLDLKMFAQGQPLPLIRRPEAVP